MTNTDQLGELALEAGEAVLDVACGAGTVMPATCEDGPEQLAAGVAAELEALSPPDKERLHAVGAELSRALMADGALRSQLVSNLAIGRR
jgi:hypothetical protein